MLTRYLHTLQDRLHLTDPEFAAEMGLDLETWQALQAGRAIYSPALLARLLLHVPNAHPLALEELRAQEQPTAIHLLDGTVSAMRTVGSVTAAMPADAPLVMAA